MKCLSPVFETFLLSACWSQWWWWWAQPQQWCWVGTFLQWHSLGKSDHTDSGHEQQLNTQQTLGATPTRFGGTFLCSCGCIAKMKALDLAEVQGGGLDTSINALIYFVSSFPRENQGKEDTEQRCCQPSLSPCKGAHWVWGGQFTLQEKLEYITLLCH